MNNEEFEKVFETIVDQMRQVLLKKAGEYATDDDRLHNFRVAAAFQGCTEQQAALGFLTKHLVSISDMVSQGTFKAFPLAVWDEKIGDALNYLVLLRAIVEEESVVVK